MLTGCGPSGGRWPLYLVGRRSEWLINCSYRRVADGIEQVRGEDGGGRRNGNRFSDAFLRSARHHGAGRSWSGSEEVGEIVEALECGRTGEGIGLESSQRLGDVLGSGGDQ